MNIKTTGIILVLTVISGVFLYSTQDKTQDYLSANRTLSELTCSSSSECELRGQDEWEECSHINNPVLDVPNHAADISSMSERGYICKCMENAKCGWKNNKEEMELIDRTVMDYIQEHQGNICNNENTQISNKFITESKTTSRAVCFCGNDCLVICEYEIQKENGIWKIVKPENTLCEVS